MVLESMVANAPTRLLTAVGAATLFFAVVLQPALARESRSYVTSKFWHAVNSQDGDCPQGINPKLKEQYELDLLDLGYSRSDVVRMMEKYVEGEPGGWDQQVVKRLMNTRGRFEGKPVNPFANPMTVVDSKLKSLDAKFAYGFNLDGVGAAPGSFEDPETHQIGVDHQLARVLGCIEPMRGRLREGAAYWLFMWTAMKDISPAWTITVSGDDLSKDGPVEVKVGRAMEPTRFNGNGTPRSGMTFREDPDPRLSGNIYKGTIKDGMVTVESQSPLFLMSEPLTFPAFHLDKFHARFKLTSDGLLDGLIAGYEPIEEIYFALGNANLSAEENFAPELPGIYHLLRRFADQNPDPKTGQNFSISATYYIQGVSSHVVPVKLEQGARAQQ